MRTWKDVQHQNAHFREEMKVQSVCDLGQVTQLGGVTGIQIQPNFLSFLLNIKFYILSIVQVCLSHSRWKDGGGTGYP